MFDANKRKFPRADYPCSLTIWRQDGGQDVILARTANIGAGGLNVHLNQKISTGSFIEISIEFPSHTTPFKCKARVVRVQENLDGEGKVFYALGVMFDHLDELKQSYLQGVVSHLIALNSQVKKN